MRKPSGGEGPRSSGGEAWRSPWAEVGPSGKAEALRLWVGQATGGGEQTWAGRESNEDS